jgi:hypothetical protein
MAELKKILKNKKSGMQRKLSTPSKILKKIDFRIIGEI